MKSVQCGICDKKFTDVAVVEAAKRIARHWNEEHRDELEVGMTPFRSENRITHHLHGDEYACVLDEEYITAYDVLDTSGHTCGPFAYEYVREPEAEDVCDDCWRHINGVDGYREIDATGWRTKYRCDECHRERQIERRKDENQNLGEFA
jgi:hypothetical protein